MKLVKKECSLFSRSKRKPGILLAAVLMFVFCISLPASAESNPSTNVQNGDIWRYDSTGQPMIDNDFDAPLGAGEIRLSQQIIADNGEGNFDVELKVQGGSEIRVVPDEAVVFLLDDSASITTTNWQHMRNACVNMLNSFSPEINSYFGIVRFSSTAVTSLNLTNDRTIVRGALSTLPQANGGTNLFAGLTLAEQVLNTYTGSGPKHIVLITDGVPTTGGTTEQCFQKVGQLKNNGVFVYAAGFGSGVNLDFINQLASNSESSVYVSGASQLVDLLSNPSTGYGAAIAKNSRRNVAVNMGSKINFVSVISNDGGNASVTGVNGTLFWDPALAGSSDLTGVRTLVYRVQVEESMRDQGFMAVSNSAVLRYMQADNQARAVNFDLPKVQFTSNVTYTVKYYRDAVAEGNLVGTSLPITVSKGADVRGDIDLSANRPADYRQGELVAESTVVNVTGQVFNVIYMPKEIPESEGYTFTPDSGRFNGQPHLVAVTAPEESGNILAVYYNGSTTPPVDAGIYEISLDVADTETHVAAAGLVIGNLSVAKKTLTIDDLDCDLESVFYDGAPHARDVAVNDSLYDGVVTVLYNGSSDAPRVKGDYEVTALIGETGNYNYTEIMLGTFKIEPSAKLIDVTVSGKKESKTLSGDQLTYTLSVPTNINQLTISAIQLDPDAEIAGLGTYKLNPNKATTIQLTVTTQNGTSLVYTINVVRVTGNGNGVITVL